MFQVIENRRIAKDIYRLRLKGKLVQSMTEPGQFVHLRVSQEWETPLRRPISICDIDVKQSILTVLYRVEGRGTTRLARYKAGEWIDVLGPLGQGFPLDHIQTGQRVALVGGGIGVPPLYYLSKKLAEKGARVTHILGFQSAAHCFYEQEFHTWGETRIATVDGSRGTKGLVTDVLEPPEQWDTLYACGPTPMLKALEQRFQQHPHAYLSLEDRMACGIGACFACVRHVPYDNNDYRKVCVDGPVFKVGEVVI